MLADEIAYIYQENFEKIVVLIKYKCKVMNSMK